MSGPAEKARPRLVGYDLARALAVFGMVLVNFKVVMGAESAGPGWLVALTGLVDGRAAATFVVLAGAGISLMTRWGRRHDDPAAILRDRRSLRRRALFLFIVGLAYTPLWPADILHFYGVYIAIAASFTTARVRLLLLSAGGLVGLFVVLMLTLDWEAGWNFETLEYAGFWTPDGMVRHLFFNGFHPVVPWLAFMLVGMAVGRQRVREAPVRRRLLFLGLGVALLAELLSVGLGAVGTGTPEELELWLALVGTDPMPPMPLYMFAGAGWAVALIMVCHELALRWPDARWLSPLVATGRLALTLYVAHVVVGMGVLELLGRLEGQSLGFAVISASVFCAGSVVFATLWTRWFGRGPLERVMRRVTG